jgi:hypothetical protein
MASIYGSSALTITTSGATSSADGFLHKRSYQNFQMNSTSDQTVHVQVRQLAWHSGYFFNVGSEEMFPTSKGNELKLYTRAWCFQERILAPRVLHFLPHELVFECMTKAFCECGVADVFRSDNMLKPVYARQFDQSKSSQSM